MPNRKRVPLMMRDLKPRPPWDRCLPLRRHVQGSRPMDIDDESLDKIAQGLLDRMAPLFVSQISVNTANIVFDRLLRDEEFLDLLANIVAEKLRER